MAKMIYGGVALPKIPDLNDYPYVVMARNGETYQILYSKGLWYFSSSQLTNDVSESEPYYYCNPNTQDIWTEGTAGNYAFSSPDRPFVWCSHDVPNGSATSTNIKHYHTTPIPVEQSSGWILTEDSSSFVSADNKFELGTEFLCKKTTKMIGARVFATNNQKNSELAIRLWTIDGTKLAETNSTFCESGKWFNLLFANPIEIESGKSYVLSAYFNSYYYVESSSLTFSDVASFVQSRYTQSDGAFPSTTFNQKLYGLVDILYEVESGDEPDLEPEHSTKYLIESEGFICTVIDDELMLLEATELTAEIFQNHGFDELPDWSIISSLTNPEILYYQSDVEAELPTISVTMTATPHPQSLIAEPFYLIDSTILGIESVTCEYVGEPLIALSFDNGGFEHYDGTNEWVVSAESEGMLPNVLTTITTDTWSARITDVQSIQIRVILKSADDSLTSIKFNFIN